MWAAARVAWAAKTPRRPPSAKNPGRRTSNRAAVGTLRSEGCRRRPYGFSVRASSSYMWAPGPFLSYLRRAPRALATTLRRLRGAPPLLNVRSPLASFSSCSLSSSKPASFWALRTLLAKDPAPAAQINQHALRYSSGRRRLVPSGADSSPIFWARRSSKLRARHRSHLKRHEHRPNSTPGNTP